MGKVYGPFDAGDWLTLKMLRSNIAWMKETNQTKYAMAIKKETSLFKKYKDGTLFADNDNIERSVAA
jgi:hypothetical protein